MTLGKEALVHIIKTKSASLFRVLKLEWFVQDEIPIYNKVLEIFIKYSRFPSISYLQKTFDISDIDTDYPDKFYLDELRKRNLASKLVELGTRMGDKLRQGETFNAIDLLTEFSTEYQLNTVQSTEIQNLEDMKENLSEYFNYVRSRIGLIGVPSGWDYLDSQSTGFQKGDIYCIMARVKTGKTMALIYMANHAFNRGYKPLFITMEMTCTQVIRRLAALRSGIGMQYIKTGEISEFAKGHLFDSMNSNRPFYIVEGQFKKTIAEISATVMALNPDIVYIDGGYLIKTNTNYNSARWEKMAEVIESLKTLAVTAKVPIVISFQFNRQVKADSHNAGLEHIQLSDAISQILSIGIGIFNEDSPELKRIEILGGREGEDGTFMINWDWNRMNFTQIGGELNG